MPKTNQAPSTTTNPQAKEESTVPIENADSQADGAKERIEENAEVPISRPNAEGEKDTNSSKAPDTEKKYVDKDGNEYTFKPSKNWNGNTNKNGNFPAKNGDEWSPLTSHKGTHKPHHDI